MKNTNNLEKVLSFFRKIETIPRGSGNEKGISDYLVAFAKERNLEVHQDEFLNVIIKKPATPGLENRPTVILQGHMDMVCEKTADSTHNFLTDPITLIEDGDWLRANNTTLGADNGVAVAMALAILDSDSIEHGPLEVLITTSEETGMDGAINVDGSLLNGTYLLNLDTEEEDEFIVSCAGGSNITVTVPLLREKHDSSYDTGLKITIDGLHGGHSGIEIHGQFANANQLMARTLFELAQRFNYEMAYYQGGSKHNAIPNSAEVEIAIKSADKEAITAYLVERENLFQKEFAPQEKHISVHSTIIEVPEFVYAKATTEGLLSYLYLAPHGVISMSQSIPGLVETSVNVAIVRQQNHALEVLLSMRSSSPMALHYLGQRLLLLANKVGVSAELHTGYPAWVYEPGSPLEAQAAKIYEKTMGKAPKIAAVHAGLECGLLKKHLPQTAMLSFGPTIKYAHTPKEQVHLPSLERINTFLLTLLKELQ